MDMAKKTRTLLPLKMARALEEIPVTNSLRPVARGRAAYVLARVTDYQGKILSEEKQKVATRKK